MLSASPHEMDDFKWTRSNPFDRAGSGIGVEVGATSLTSFSTTTSTRMVSSSALDIPSSSSTRLSFPKLSIPLRSPSASTCTDSDLIHSDPGAMEDQPSPSLISYIFARKASIGGSSSSNGGNETPITPQLVNPSCNRPILRRPQSSSLNCTTSDDGAAYSKSTCMIQGMSNLHSSLHGGFNGLGLSIDQSRPVPTSSTSRVEKRQSCLTFAVRSPPSRQATSLVSPASQRSVPLEQVATEDTLADDAALDDEDESDDDGYEEDEEGGFTSDEDLTSPFTRGLPTSSGSSFISSRPYTPNTYSPVFPPVSLPLSTSTSDEGVPVDSRRTSPSRGRKISIATSKCAERCSRHRSPPPTSRQILATSPECPPAARSPSALELCKRRQSTTPSKDWKSDGTSGIVRTRSMGPSLPCKSILRMSSQAVVVSGAGSTAGSIGVVNSSGLRRASMSAVEALESGVGV